MYPADGPQSQLEWNASLNPIYVPAPTEKTKYHRKVSLVPNIWHIYVLIVQLSDFYYCDHR